MLVQSVSKVWIVLSFRINHKYIAAKLCVQRNNPHNECNGKCWLKKELEKSGDNESNQPSQRNEPTEFSFICDSEECDLTDLFPVETDNKGFYPKESPQSDFFKDIFHPPKNNSI